MSHFTIMVVHPMHAAEPASQASCRTHPSRSWWCIRGCTTSPDACSRASQSSLMPHPPIHPSIHSSILSCAGGAGGNRRITCGRCDCGLCVTDGCAGWQHWPQHGSRFGKGQAPLHPASFSSSPPLPCTSLPLVVHNSLHGMQLKCSGMCCMLHL